MMKFLVTYSVDNEKGDLVVNNFCKANEIITEDVPPQYKTKYFIFDKSKRDLVVNFLEQNEYIVEYMDL